MLDLNFSGEETGEFLRMVDLGKLPRVIGNQRSASSRWQMLKLVSYSGCMNTRCR